MLSVPKSILSRRSLLASVLLVGLLPTASFGADNPKTITLDWATYNPVSMLLKEKGLLPISAVHPTAFVAVTAPLSEGCQILARAAVCADVKMGEECIVNTAASIDHESVLGKGVHIAPGATLAGCVTVGDFSLIGVGAVILPRIKIGSDVIVGAGSVVTKDIPDGMIAFGNPARIRRASASPRA